MTSFKSRVLKIVSQIPKGKVASYGQIAVLAGKPRGARAVGWILNQTEGKNLNLPWWRVVNKNGQITIRGTKFLTKKDQAMLLRADGIKVGNLQVDIKKYIWDPKI